MSREAVASTAVARTHALLFVLQKKCEEYWPVSVGESVQPGHGLTVTLTFVLPFAEYSVRKMTVTCVSLPPYCNHAHP